MPNVPSSSRLAQITWFETHAPGWAEAPQELGLSEEAAQAVAAALQEARAAYDAARQARQAAKSATVQQEERLKMLLDVGRDAVNTIKAYIEMSEDTSLWGRAGLTPDARPGIGTAPALAMPFDLRTTLDSEGRVRLTWKARHPRGVRGVVYVIRRAIDEGEMALLDAVGGKVYLDAGVPAGTRSVRYIVQAKRGRSASALSPAALLQLGRVGRGAGVLEDPRPASLRAT